MSMPSSHSNQYTQSTSHSTSHSNSTSYSRSASLTHSRSHSGTPSLPRSVSVKCDELLRPIPPNMSRKELLESIIRMQAEMVELRSQRDHALDRVAFIRGEIEIFKQTINAKPKKRSGIRDDAELVTEEEAMVQREVLNVECKAKERKKDEAQRKRAERAGEREARRARLTADHALSGSLHTKNKDDLQDVARALKISDTGTKAVLLDRIRAHFDTHPDLKASDRFVGLFTRRSRNNSERAPPPMHSRPIVSTRMAGPHSTAKTAPTPGPSRLRSSTMAHRYSPYPSFSAAGPLT